MEVSGLWGSGRRVKSITTLVGINPHLLLCYTIAVTFRFDHPSSTPRQTAMMEMS